MGVTTYWCYFPWKIVNNLASIYRILTQLGTKMCYYTTFLCTKFQGNQVTRFNLMVTLTPLWKGEEKKYKETKPIFGSYISETPGAIYLKFGMRGTDIRGHLHSKNRLVSYKQHEVTYTRKSQNCSSCQYIYSLLGRVSAKKFNRKVLHFILSKDFHIDLPLRWSK